MALGSYLSRHRRGGTGAPASVPDPTLPYLEAAPLEVVGLGDVEDVVPVTVDESPPRITSRRVRRTEEPSMGPGDIARRAQEFLELRRACLLRRHT